MRIATYRYTKSAGWFPPLDATLDSEHSLLILFGPTELEHLMAGLDELRAAFSRACWIGCSTAGEFLGSDIDDDSLVASIIRFEKVKLVCAKAPVLQPQDSARAGALLAEELTGPGLRSVFVLADGLAVNGSALVAALRGSLPPDVIITGGLAGDGSRFQRTWLLLDKSPISHLVTAVGLYGDNLGIAHGSKGGWDTMGPERLVTRSNNNVLYELDGQPALAIYKRYLGDRAEGLPSTGLLFPLAIRNEDSHEEETVRTLLAVNETEGSITFAGDIPEGSKVQLMSANFERLINAASQAAESAVLDEYTDGPLLCVAISCVGRRLVLGQRTEEELEATIDILPPGAKQIGYYSYGEISPLTSGRCDLHNQTMTLTLFWET